MNKIIFINRYFYPDHSATSQMLSDLAFGIVDKIDNKEIHIVTSRQQYDDASADLPDEEMINNIHIHRVWTSCFGRQNLVGRMIDYLSFYVSSAFRLMLLTQKGDMLVAKTDPPLISVIAAIVAKLKKAELVNWLQDLFPEVAAELGVKLVQGLPFIVLRDIRNKTLKYAKMNVAIGDLMAEKLLKEGIKKDKIMVIHNWADGEQIKPVQHEHNPLRKQWGLEGKFVIGYSGNVGRSHNFSTILEAAEKLKNNPKIIFLFIGAGAQLAEIKETCRANGLENVFFKPYQPREKLDESLSASDVHLVSLKPELEGLIVPSKFYGILAAGRPVIFIGDKEGELSSIIKQNHCGQIVEQNNSDQLVLEINRQLNKQGDTKFEKEIRSLFDRKYSKTRAIDYFRDTIR